LKYEPDLFKYFDESVGDPVVGLFRGCAVEQLQSRLDDVGGVNDDSGNGARSATGNERPPVNISVSMLLIWLRAKTSEISKLFSLKHLGTDLDWFTSLAPKNSAQLVARSKVD
jgi:hypothetical protein